jgi:hypothetical protein
MSNIFRKFYSLPIPPDAELVTVNNKPSARFKKKGKPKTAPLTKDGRRIRVQSPFWYGWIKGEEVKLFTDAAASQQRLAELIRKAERQQSGILDPFEDHRKRPLTEHIDDCADDLLNRGKTNNHTRTPDDMANFLAGCKARREAKQAAAVTRKPSAATIARKYAQIDTIIVEKNGHGIAWPSFECERAAHATTFRIHLTRAEFARQQDGNGQRSEGPVGLHRHLQRLVRLGVVENGLPAPCPMSPSNEPFTTLRLPATDV